MADEATTQVLGQITHQLSDIRERQILHGQTLATLEERSEQHEKRMNRHDRRALVSGAGSGGLIATVFMGIKMWFTGS